MTKCNFVDQPAVANILTMEEKRCVIDLSWEYSIEVPANADGMTLFWHGYGYEMAEQCLPWETSYERAVCMQDMAWNRAQKLRKERRIENKEAAASA